ncbi:hypothetical protein MEQU1_000017 [Malassezia equina]|uniref:Uncharacterized protein n=1 Tax=Malassezia equina TaxID=1381935 RepID=A0AAF0IX11_9BASI|nr:hypothetical protein MEQU1_000017 [Malassezia equina]
MPSLAGQAQEAEGGPRPQAQAPGQAQQGERVVPLPEAAAAQHVLEQREAAADENVAAEVLTISAQAQAAQAVPEVLALKLARESVVGPADVAWN